MEFMLMVVPVNEYGGSRVAKEVLKYGLGVSGLKNQA